MVLDCHWNVKPKPTGTEARLKLKVVELIPAPGLHAVAPTVGEPAQLVAELAVTAMFNVDNPPPPVMATLPEYVPVVAGATNLTYTGVDVNAPPV